MEKKYQIKGLFIGKGTQLSDGSYSAIRKKPVDRLEIFKDRILGDEVVNKKHHGGDLRVLHHFSKVNYDHLKETFSDISDRFIPGTYGENIYTEELTEKDLYIGDIFQLGSAKIQLTAPRRPCGTINSSYNDNRVLTEVIRSGHCGWFYHILEEGSVSIGDGISLLERPYPDLPISKLFFQGYGQDRFSDTEFLRKCYDTGLLEKGWKPIIERVLNIAR